MSKEKDNKAIVFLDTDLNDFDDSNELNCGDEVIIHGQRLTLVEMKFEVERDHMKAFLLADLRFQGEIR